MVDLVVGRHVAQMNVARLDGDKASVRLVDAGDVERGLLEGGVEGDAAVLANFSMPCDR